VRAQIFSDLHLDFAGGYVPTPAPDADLLITAGDLGHSPDALRVLTDWPVPVIAIPGNHEYDGSNIADADEELREIAQQIGITYLNKDVHVVHTNDGRAVRFVGCSRWWDFDLLGESRREEMMQFGGRYLRHMASAHNGLPLTAQDVRDFAVDHRTWLAETLREPFDGTTVVITHSGPSKASADPRYGLAAGTASFCNNDDDLLPYAHIWIHGHLHCPHDYTVAHERGSTRVVCNPRGYERLREHETYETAKLILI
jgi:DNA repair exonuclease SbcCD nuclease subunit